MTWQILESEPAHAVCDQCKRHDCGIVDGEHKWVRTGIIDEFGDHIIIGYECVNAWAENLGISREIVEREVVRPPTPAEVGLAVVGWGHFKWGEAHYGNDLLVASVPSDNATGDARQQADQGTSSKEESGSGTSETGGTSVRKPANVRTRKANGKRNNTTRTKDSG